MEGWNEGEEEKDGEEEKRGYANGEMRKKEGNEGEVKPHAIRILDNTTFLCVVLPLHGCATGCLISLFVSNIMHTQTHTHTHTHTSNCTGCVLPLSLSPMSHLQLRHRRQPAPTAVADPEAVCVGLHQNRFIVGGGDMAGIGECQYSVKRVLLILFTDIDEMHIQSKPPIQTHA